jgi:hypothetical protein
MADNSNWLDEFFTKNGWAVLMLLVTIAAGVGASLLQLHNLEKSQDKLAASVELWRNEVEAKVGDARARILVLERLQNVQAR